MPLQASACVLKCTSCPAQIVLHISTICTAYNHRCRTKKHRGCSATLSFRVLQPPRHSRTDHTAYNNRPYCPQPPVLY